MGRDSQDATPLPGLPPASGSGEGRGVVTSFGAALCIRVGRCTCRCGSGAGPGSRCRQRGAGCARRYLLRPGRQPHVAGLEGRRRRGGQGFLRGKCPSGRLEASGSELRTGLGADIRRAHTRGGPRKEAPSFIRYGRRPRNCPEALPGSPPRFGPRPWPGFCLLFATLASPLLPTLFHSWWLCSAENLPSSRPLHTSPSGCSHWALLVPYFSPASVLVQNKGTWMSNMLHTLGE